MTVPDSTNDPVGSSADALRDRPKFTRDAEALAAAELALIRARSGRGEDRPTLLGLSLSGGGIRSASFALGVLHALVRAGKLRHFDYLSTVSGGGYTGTALTWMLSTYPGAGVEPENFPLSSPAEGKVGVAGNPPPLPRPPLLALDWIRRRGKYLTPQRRLDLVSAFGVVLRGMTISLFVALTLMLVAFAVLRCFSVALNKQLPAIGTLQAFPIFENPEFAFWNTWAWLSVAVAITFVLGGLAFALTTRWRPKDVHRAYLLRRDAQVWLGYVLKGLCFALVLASLPAVRAKLADVTWESAFSFMTVGGGAAIGRLVLARRPGEGLSAVLQGFLAVVAAVALGYGLLLLDYGASGRLLSYSAWTTATVAVLALVGGLVVGLYPNANYTSPHRMYRDRLMEAFMPRADQIARGDGGKTDEAPVRTPPDPVALDPDRALLCETGRCGRDAENKRIPYAGPYHLINTNMVVGGSADPSLHDRGGESFLLSPLYCGSRVTGWRRTDRYALEGSTDHSSTMTLASAMAISAAAANPHTGAAGRGVTRSLPIGLVMGLLNIRLGYFEINPDDSRRRRGPARPNHLWPGMAEAFGSGAREDRHFVELSDGGHFENLGVYELLRREVDLILCCDGGADPGYSFGDLANLIERARVDFGVNIDFVPGFEHEKLAVRDPGDEHEDRPKVADPGFALGRISYPAKATSGSAAPGSRPAKVGLLVYLKSTLIAGLPADLIAYRSAHPAFPHETTADQFFSEEQFEAYRELGYRIGRHLLAHSLIQSLLGEEQAEPAGGMIAALKRIKDTAEGREA